MCTQYVGSGLEREGTCLKGAGSASKPRTNVYTLICFCLLLLVFKNGNFQLRHSPFFTWFVLRFTSFS